MILRLSLTALVAALALAGPPAPAAAQTYPNRPITLVIPFPPGGSTSIVGRTVADKMSEIARPADRRRQPRRRRRHHRHPRGGEEHARRLHDPARLYRHARDRPDALSKRAGYDPRKDFAPIGMIGHAPNSLVVHPSTPAKSVQELVAHAKANPGKVNYGSAGVGTVSHVSGEYFANAAGMKLVHIPYKGTGPALADLIGGHIPMAFAPIPATHGPVSQGLLRGLAVTSAKRSSLVPELPTIAESGIKDFEASLYYGLVAPAGTPRADHRAPQQGAARGARHRRGAQAPDQ